MALTTTVRARRLLQKAEKATNAKLNSMALVSVTVEGTASQLTDGPNSAPATGQPLVWNGTRYNPGSVGGSYVSLPTNLSQDIFLNQTFY